MKQDTREWLLKWFQVRNPGVSVSPDSAIYDDGLLDSFGFIELLDEIEHVHGVKLEFEDLARASRNTITNLAAIIDDGNKRR